MTVGVKREAGDQYDQWISDFAFFLPASSWQQPPVELSNQQLSLAACHDHNLHCDL